MSRIQFLSALLVGVLLLSACSAAAPAPEMAAPMEAPAVEVVEEQSFAGEAAEMVANDADRAAVVLAQPADRKIIYRANVSLVVPDTQRTMAQIEELTAASGGYIAGSQLSRYSGDLMRGHMTVRVPVESHGAFLAALRAMAVRVLSEDNTAEDVTAEYTDLEARLRNLEAAEQELLALLEEVRERPNATAEDILEVFDAVTEKRGEIEQVKGRMQYLSNLTALTTINIELVPDEATKPVVEEGWQPLVTVKDAFRTLISLLQGLINLLINLVIVVLPILVIVAIPFLLVFLLIRWWRRRSRGLS